jgi:hypothetical protein
MDGDCECGPRALPMMQKRLLSDTSTMGIAGLPLSGRSKSVLQGYVKEWRWLYGGLYAIKTSRLVWLRANGIRLPLGLCGSDHVITRMLRARTDSATQVDCNQVTYCENAGFSYDSMRLFTPRDWKMYIRRMITYRLRQFQLCHLGESPTRHLPATMDDINLRILRHLRMQWLVDPLDRAVRRRLGRLYPTDDTRYYENLLERTSQGAAIAMAGGGAADTECATGQKSSMPLHTIACNNS